LRKLKKYEEFIEKHSPIVKPSGIFFFSSVGLPRPEVVRHRVRFSERFTPAGEILVLMPQTKTKPFHRSKLYKKLVKALRGVLREEEANIQVCFYEAPFGLVPIELDEVYPLSQHETVLPPDSETVEYVAAQAVYHISRGNYKAVVFLNNPSVWGEKILEACRKVCQEKGMIFKHFEVEMDWPNLVADFLKGFGKDRKGGCLS